MKSSPYHDPYTIAKLRNLLKFESHARSVSRFDKKDAVSEIKELLIEYLKKQKLALGGEISDYLLKEVERAAHLVVESARLQVLTDDLLSLADKEDSK